MSRPKTAKQRSSVPAQRRTRERPSSSSGGGGGGGERRGEEKGREGVEEIWGGWVEWITVVTHNCQRWLTKPQAFKQLLGGNPDCKLKTQGLIFYTMLVEISEVWFKVALGDKRFSLVA